MQTATSADGTPIAFDRSGDGPPLIVVTGALADRAAVLPLTPLLDGLFTIVAYDRRGRGGSGDTQPFAVDREIEDLGAVIDAVGGEAFVFGHSSGAALGLEATLAGLPITKLALYEPPYIVDGSRDPVPSDHVQRVRDLVAHGRRADAVELFLTSAVGVPPEIVVSMREMPVWPQLESLAHTIGNDGEVMDGFMSGRPLPADRFGAVTIPTLLMAGSASPDWARTSVAQLASIIPNARHRILEGQDHGAAPEAVAPVLEDFFLG